MNTLHLVSHTHWDREWYLTFQQFRLKLISLVDDLLSILESDGDYLFFMLDGQTIVLEDYLALRPQNKERLEHYIRSGRILIGPWHILPDEFLVSPEATIRNLLQGDQICSSFGTKMKIGYIPDPFGHIGQMPQILSGFGIQSAVLRRGLSDEPTELWWQSPDGSKVFIIYLREGYDNAAGLPTSDPVRFPLEVQRLHDNLAPYTHSGHFLLMHGTDHMPPSADTSRAIQAAQGKLSGDALIHSNLPDYLDSVRQALNLDGLPVITGELRSSKKHHLLPGVLSTRMWIKQRNHASQTLLEKWAEPFSTFATLDTPSNHKRLDDPAAILQKTWHLLMENHPHDSICGCSIDQVHDEMRVRFDQVDQIGEELVQQNLSALAGEINTRLESTDNAFASLVIFNPNSQAGNDLITCQVKLPRSVSRFQLVGPGGEVIPHLLHGQNSLEIINFILESETLAGLKGSVHDGMVQDLSFQSVDFIREGDLVHLDLVFEKNLPPNLVEWQKSMDQLEAFLQDNAIKRFHVRASYPSQAFISFVARDVPALGWKVINLRPMDQPVADQVKLTKFQMKWMPLLMKLAQKQVFKSVFALVTRSKKKAPIHIENEFFTVTLDRSGSFSLLDKRDRQRYLGLNRFIDGGDRGDEYNYCPPESDVLLNTRLTRSSLDITDVQQSISAYLEIQAPGQLAADRKSRSGQVSSISIETRVSLTAGMPRLEFHTRIHNPVRDHRLRVHFPFKTNQQPNEITSCFDGHFEVVKRPIGLPDFDSNWVEHPRPEQPQRAFTDVSDGTRGLLLANRGLPEVEVLKTSEGVEIALTLLRCVGWLSRDDFSNRRGHAGPNLATPDAQMLGDWEFDYSLIPHHGSWDTSPDGRLPFLDAFAFNSPMRALANDIHPGAVPGSASMLLSSPQRFVITAIKQGQTPDSWIVRGYNISDEQITINLKPWFKPASAWRSNLAEETLARLEPDPAGGFSLSAKPQEIVTVKFEIGG